jgi:hypothetical protein
MNYEQLEKQIKSNIEKHIDFQMELLEGLDWVKRENFSYSTYLFTNNGKDSLMINFDGGLLYSDLHNYKTELFEHDRAVKIFGLENLEWSQYDNVSIIVNV